MSDWKMKRFWKEAAVIEDAAGFAIALDGRPVKTPAKRLLCVPTRALGAAIAAEWDAQDGEINPDAMPMTKTANAAIDKVSIQHSEVADMLAAYGDSDLLCYRAEAPEALVARQAAEWDPMLDWAAQVLGVRLAPRVGVMHAPQDPRDLDRLREATHGFDPFELAAFHDLVSLSGSLILGFAATHADQDPAHLWRISRLDEIWQAEQWGRDDMAEEAAAIKERAFMHARRVFELLRA